MAFNPAYIYNGKLYLNITNRCTNECCFCIRNSKSGVGCDLVLDHEPKTKEILDAIEKLPISEEVTFCGFGESLLRPGVICEVSKELKKKHGSKIRVNTNGLAEAFLGKKILPDLNGLVDTISISLNAENAEKYLEVCKPAMGIDSFSEVLKFARASKKYIPRVILSVVDLPQIDVEACREIAEEIGAEFRARSLIT